MASLLLLAALFSPSAQAWSGKCAQFANKPAYLETISLLAGRMKYTPEELCNLPNLADIFISERDLFNKETQEDEAHIWVSLHYNEYSCQYFVRKADQAVTRKECYNTW